MARNSAVFKADFLEEKLKNITLDKDNEYSSLRRQVIADYPKIVSLQENGVSRKAIYAAIMEGIPDENRISEATFYAYLVAAKKEYLAQQKAKVKEEKKEEKAKKTTEMPKEKKGRARFFRRKIKNCRTRQEN